MSWFSEIAGKAEDLLNKIDQNAATVINQAAAVAETRVSKSKGGGGRRGKDKGAHSTSSSRTSTSVIVDNNSTASGGGGDEGLKIINGGGETDNGGLSSSSSNWGEMGEAKGTSSVIITVPPPAEKDKSHNKSKKKSSSSSPSHSHSKSTTKKPSETTLTTPTPPITNKDEDGLLIDFLNDSNKKEVDETLVLQTELRNQAREVELLYKTNKQLQSENESLKSRVHSLEEASKSLKGAEHVEAELRQSEAAQKNLKKMLGDKDTEITKLRKSLDSSLSKLKELEVLQSTQNRLEQVEMDKSKLVQANEELKGELSLSKERIEILDNHVDNMKSGLKSLEEEFSSYKEKAKGILKQKDDLISSLQQGGGGGIGGREDEDNHHPYLSEINALKSERELLNAEISQCRSTIESLREETSRVESDLANLRRSNFEHQKLLYEEKSLSSTLQDENLGLRQQLSSLQFEVDMERSERRKLQEEEDRKIVETNNNNHHQAILTSPKRSSGNPLSYGGGDTEETLRMRITALSQSLLEKQGLINSLSSDKQLLQINVERLQQELHQQGASGSSSSHNLHHSDYPHTVISNKPLYLSESPWDSGMSSSVKRAFSTVDGFCCQAGLVLRRRPNLRLGFCIYILVLHFWVLFILYHFFGHVPHYQGGDHDMDMPPGGLPPSTMKK